jgi:hypothetical protein
LLGALLYNSTTPAPPSITLNTPTRIGGTTISGVYKFAAGSSGTGTLTFSELTTTMHLDVFDSSGTTVHNFINIIAGSTTATFNMTSLSPSATNYVRFYPTTGPIIVVGVLSIASP